MQTLFFSLLLAATASSPTEAQSLYVLGSSIHLRKEPAKEAESLDKLPIGTECTVTEKPSAEWLKVRCGEKEGYASAALLGPEKPSLEKLKAEANNPKLKLQQRVDSALRAASLAPEDAALQKQLGTLFFELNLQLTAASKKPALKRTFSCRCSEGDAFTCVKICSARGLRNVEVRAEVKKNWFVAAISDGENMALYRGSFRYDKRKGVLTGEVFERTRFTASPVLEKALFAGIARTPDDDLLDPLGQYVLDESSEALLYGIPPVWGELIQGEGGHWFMHWFDCYHRPYQVRFEPDIHGRWLLVMEGTKWDSGYARFVSAVSRNGNTLELTLASVDNGKLTKESFKLPEPGSDQASLREKLYSYNIQRYPELHRPCREGGP